MEQVKAYDDKLETMIMGIQPMLDCVNLEQPEGARLPSDGLYRSIMDHCRIAWVDFKEFTCITAHGSVIHTLT